MGAIASVGSSILMAWAEPMQTEDEIGDILSGQYANNKKYTLGGLFYNGQMSMLDNYPTATGKEVMETWVMFGDPSCMFRSQNPAALNVTHNSCFNPAVNSFSISSSFGPNTYACVSQNNQIVGTAAITSGNTNIAFTQTYSASQPLVLTVTEYNKIPYTATLTACLATGVSGNTISDQITMQSIVSNEIAINYSGLSGNMIVDIYDLSGKIISSQPVIFEGTGNISINCSSFAPAIYLVAVKGDTGDVLKTVKVIKQ
jgi:gingipain R